MKVHVTDPTALVVFSFDQAPAGLIGRIRNSTNVQQNGLLVIKGHRSLVALETRGSNDAGDQWSEPSFQIEALPVGSVVTLTI